MPEITTQEIKEYLKRIQGQTIALKDIRSEFNILPGSKSFDAVRNIMFQLAEQKVVRPIGHRGEYKVVTPVNPVQIFGTQRERRPPFDLVFPRDFNTMEEMKFSKDVVIREGDLITLGGVKSKGKTTLCLLFCAENVDKNPILMGNEYTTKITDSNGLESYEPTSRFLNRLDKMKEWVNWTDENGMDKFTLLPVRDDYAEHVIKDRINIIDWINLGGDKLYDIGKLLENIKANLGRGIAIISLQKGEGAVNPRGGQFVRDFSDLEILLDGIGENTNDDILLTVKDAKEKKKPIAGKTYSYSIGDSGTKIFNFREVKKCHQCNGTGFYKGSYCGSCEGKCWLDVGTTEY
jgi:hypothetical protein